MKRFCLALVSLSLVLVMAPAAKAQVSGGGDAATTAPSANKLTLQQAVALALEKNPTIHAADAYTEGVRQSIAAAQSGHYPKVDFSEGLVRGNNPVYVFGSLLTQQQFTANNFALSFLNTPPPLNNFRTQFTATMPLYDAGETGHRVRDARLGAESARHAASRTGQQVMFGVMQAYFDQLLARESVRVAESSVKMTGADLDRAQARAQQGLTVPSDILSAQVQLAAAKEELIRARNALAISQAALNVAMGLPEDAPTEAEGAFTETAIDAGTLPEQQQFALAHRPDYLQATLAKERSSNGVSTARSAFLPRVGLFSSWEQDNQRFLSRGGNNWAAGVSVNFNIFNGGADRARLQEAKFYQTQAEAMSEQMASQVRLQVRQAFLNLQAARDRMDVTRESAAQANESLRILRDRYETGLAGMTDLLRAETAETTAERNHLNAVYDYRLAGATLELSTGRLAQNSNLIAAQTTP
jgi:outer membrane protein